MSVIISGGGSDGDDDGDGHGEESPMSGVREAFVRGGVRLKNRCFSIKRCGWRRGSLVARDSSTVESKAVLIFLIPAKVGGWRRTLSVAKAEAKR